MGIGSSIIYLGEPLYSGSVNSHNRPMFSPLRYPSIVLLFSSALWGVSWLPLKFLDALGFHSLVIIAIAYGVLFVVTVPFALGGYWRFRRQWGFLLGIFAAGGLANACFNYALINGEVLRVMALFYLLPVWGVLGGYFILKEKTSLWRWAGVVLALSGAAILLEVHTVWDNSISLIDWVSIASGLCFAATILLFRGVEQVPLAVKLNTLFMGCAVLATVGMLVWGIGASVLEGGAALLWIVAFAVGWLLWANLGSQWACTKLPAGRSSIIIVMELVAASLSAVLIGEEALTLNIVIGGALILSATAIEVVNSISGVQS